MVAVINRSSSLLPVWHDQEISYQRLAMNEDFTIPEREVAQVFSHENKNLVALLRNILNQRVGKE